MSAVETPPPPTPVERRCERCGARLSTEQEWCLDCGAAVGTTVASPRGWRASLAVVGVLLGLALIALVLALVELSGDAEQVTEVPQTATPAPTASPAAPQGDEGEPGASATPSPSQPSAPLAEWPEGQTAWTVILNSSGTREDAERIGDELAGKGVPNVGVLDSDDFESLGPDSFIVFSGVYDDRAQADEALDQVRDQAGGGSARRVVPADAAGKQGTQEPQEQPQKQP